MFSRIRGLGLAIILVPALWMPVARAQGTVAADTSIVAAEPNDDLAKQLQNPVAALISVPFQNNFDFGIGPNKVTRYLLNVQPVIPFSLNDSYNLITRTIVPIINQPSAAAGSPGAFGLGDIAESIFLSPKAPVGGFIVGAGPVALLPTATSKVLGAGKFGLGPTIVVLKQQSGFTYGILANQIWSFAGEGGRPPVNASFLQPFLSYTLKTSTTFAVNTESTYDWTRRQWTVPINLSISQLAIIEKQPLSFAIGAREYATRPFGGPDWGLRFVVTFLFPA